jgi:hypothetical protein
MVKQMITIHDLATGEVIEREMTAEELTQLDADKAESAAQASLEATKAATRQAVLDKLGLTADEVAALLG